MANIANKNVIKTLGDLRSILEVHSEFPDEQPIEFSDSDYNVYMISCDPILEDIEEVDEEDEEIEYEFGEVVVDPDKPGKKLVFFVDESE